MLGRGNLLTIGVTNEICPVSYFVSSRVQGLCNFCVVCLDSPEKKQIADKEWNIITQQVKDALKKRASGPVGKIYLLFQDEMQTRVHAQGVI